MMKEMTDACDGVREGDRGQRKWPAAHRRDDRDVRGDGGVQRGVGEGRRYDRRRRAETLVGGQKDRLRRREPDGDRRPLCRSEEHTSELQSLLRISSAAFCLKTKIHKCTPALTSQ